MNGISPMVKGEGAVLPSSGPAGGSWVLMTGEKTLVPGIARDERSRRYSRGATLPAVMGRGLGVE